MIEALESRYSAEECSFNTSSAPSKDKIYADRRVAEKIEIWTRRIWQSTTSFPVESETSPGSRRLRVPLSSLEI